MFSEYASSILQVQDVIFLHFIGINVKNRSNELEISTSVNESNKHSKETYSQICITSILKFIK